MGQMGLVREKQTSCAKWGAMSKTPERAMKRSGGVQSPSLPHARLASRSAQSCAPIHIHTHIHVCVCGVRVGLCVGLCVDYAWGYAWIQCGVKVWDYVWREGGE